MNHEPTSADRLGASFNCCLAHDRCQQAAARVLAASADRLPPAEQAPLRAEYDARKVELNRFYEGVKQAFGVRTPAPYTDNESR